MGQREYIPCSVKLNYFEQPVPDTSWEMTPSLLPDGGALVEVKRVQTGSLPEAVHEQLLAGQALPIRPPEQLWLVASARPPCLVAGIAVEQQGKLQMASRRTQKTFPASGKLIMLEWLVDSGPLYP